MQKFYTDGEGVHELLDKAHFGKLVASLLYSSHAIDPETAENIVQDLF